MEDWLEKKNYSWLRKQIRRRPRHKKYASAEKYQRSESSKDYRDCHWAVQLRYGGDSLHSWEYAGALEIVNKRRVQMIDLMPLMTSAAAIFVSFHLSKTWREDQKLQSTVGVQFGLRAIDMVWFGSVRRSGDRSGRSNDGLEARVPDLGFRVKFPDGSRGLPQNAAFF